MSYKNVLSRKIIIRLIGLLVIACVLFADAAALFGSSDRRDGRVKRWNRFNPDARPRTFRRMMDPETARAVGLEKKGCPSEECPECPTCPEPIVCGDDTMLEVLFDESDVGSPKAVAAVERLQKGQCIPSAPVVTCGEGSSLIDGECIPSYPETSCGEGTMLVDGECVPASQPVTCGEGTTLVGGECVCADEVEVPACIDTDGGEDIFVKGNTTGVWDFYGAGSTTVSSHQDYCRSNYGTVNGLPKGVGEYYCNDDGRKSEKYYDCPNGCEDGVCVPDPDISCTDTDGGEDIYVKGNTTGVWDFYGADSTTVSSHQDYCRSNYGTVNGLPKGVGEYYCNDDDRKSEKYYDCPNGCEDGVCVPDEVPEVAPACIDTDGGEDLYVKGNTTGVWDSYGPGSTTVSSHQDYCRSNYGTVNGLPKGVGEYYCNDDDRKSEKYYDCPNGCEDGVCVPDEVPEAAPDCTDTDGGEDIFVKGNTTGVWDFYGADSTTVSSHQDYCRSNYGTVNGLPKGVGEYYCNDDGRKSEKYYDCPNGCEDGACV